MAHRDELAGRTIGDFVLRERIGEGGFGAVYRCEQPLLGRAAVIKVLHHKLRSSELVLQRFMREAQLASKLDHPYAAHVYAFGVESADNLFWIAMEMVHGTTLDRWLRDRGKLPLDQFVPFFERVAEVVQTAHETGIVHRDLKPSNIMVIERAGRLLPKLLDFGIAKLLVEEPASNTVATPVERPTGHDATVALAGSNSAADTERDAPPARQSEIATVPGNVTPKPSAVATVPDAAALAPRAESPRKSGATPVGATTPSGSMTPLTQADAMIGSPPYMPPEQWIDALSVGPRSDLYSLGIVAYECLAGRRPFSAASMSAMADLHCNQPVPALGDELPPALDRFFARTLAKKPDERWGSALELAAHLRIAAGLATAPTDLPKLDETLRDSWLADAPQPLAEAIAVLDAARNVHQARDAARDLCRILLRYLLALALATRAQVRRASDDAQLLELLRALRRRDLDDDERERLLRLLLRPFATCREAHPIPELVDLVTASPEAGAPDALARLLALRPSTDLGGNEDIALTHLGLLLPALDDTLRAAAFVLDYQLVVRRGAVAERWTGLPRPKRPGLAFAGTVAADQPVLVRDGVVKVLLWPLVQTLPPTVGAEPDLFVFDGRGRHGARLVAGPAGFEQHTADVWEWFGEHVIGVDDAIADARDDERPPYVGLAAFSTADADRFVGREREIDAFVNRLRTRSLQVVVGPSGSGKSSFVHAGVVPALPAGWRSVAVRPGPTPLATLAHRLAPLVTSPELRPALEASAEKAAALIAKAAGDGVLVVIVDQLEELFTLGAPALERLRFAALLAELVGADEGPTRVVCTVRDDFLMHVEGLAPLRGFLGPALCLVGNPSRDDLVRTIVEPARRAGYELSDPTLAREMVDAVAEQRGALALLSFTASRLWELRDRRFKQLTRKAYDAMGGIGGALGRHAEATLAELTGDEPRIAADVFRQLVTAEATRAVVSTPELRQRVPRAEAVLDKLIAARLLATADIDGKPHVEIIHEALIAAWPRLAAWARDDPEGARMRDQLGTAAAQWQERGRPRGLLWRDEVLAELERWRKKPDVTLGEVAAAFADESRAASRRARRVRRAVLAVAFVVLAATSVVMFRLRGEAVREGALVEQRNAEMTTQLIKSHVDQARTKLQDGRRWEALASIVAAQRLGANSPVLDTMRAVARRTAAALEYRITSGSGRIWNVRYSSDGALLAVAGEGGAQLLHVATGKVAAHLDDSGHGVRDAVFDAEGKRIATVGFDGGARIFDTRGTLLHEMKTRNTIVRCAAWRADGRWLVTAGEQGVVEVWDPATGELHATVEADGHARASTCDFGVAGAVVGTEAGQVLLVDPDARTGVTLGRHAKWARSVAFDRAGRTLVTAGHDQLVKIWDVAAKKLVLELSANAELVAATFSPDGAHVAAAGRDGTARVWEVATGKLEYVLAGHRGTTWFVAYSNDGKRIVTSGDDGTLREWDAATGTPLAVFEGHSGAVIRAWFSPDGKQLASASYDGTVAAWRAGDVGTEVISAGEPGACRLQDRSLDEKWLYMPCAGGVQIWDAHAVTLAVRLPAGDRANAFGDRAVVARGDHLVVYRLPGGAQIADVALPAAITAVALDARRIAIADAAGAVHFVSLDGIATSTTKLAAPAEQLFLVADERWIVHDAEHLRLYDGTAELWSAPIAPGALVSAVPSPSRKLLALQGAKDLWLYADGARELTALGSHNAPVLAATFDAGEQRLVTTGEDGIAIVWDLVARRELHRLVNDKLYLAAAQFDATGRVVVAIDGAGELELFDADTGEHVGAIDGKLPHALGFIRDGDNYTGVGNNGALARWHVGRDADPLAAAERDLACAAPPGERAGTCP